MSTPVQPVSVLVAMQHRICRHGLCELLRRCGGVRLLPDVGDLQGLQSAVQNHSPDVILTSQVFLERNADSIEQTIVPAPSRPSIVLLLIRLHSSSWLELPSTIKSLIDSVIPEDSTTDELYRAVLKTSGHIHPTTTHQQLSLLTLRERQILKRLAVGLTSKEIASELGVGRRTVEAHRQRVMNKLELHNAAALTRFAIQAGAID